MLDDLTEQLRSKIQVNPETGCWDWIAATDKLGYGRVNMGRGIGVKFAHRVVFQMLRFDPVGLDLDHLCRVHGCVNPDHMEAVTHEENVRRGASSRVMKERFAEHLWCPQGHPLFGPNLYTHTTRKGYVNKQCRTCRAALDRKYKDQRRAARAATA